MMKQLIELPNGFTMIVTGLNVGIDEAMIRIGDGTGNKAVSVFISSADLPIRIDSYRSRS